MMDKMCEKKVYLDKIFCPNRRNIRFPAREVFCFYQYIKTFTIPIEI